MSEMTLPDGLTEDLLKKSLQKKSSNDITIKTIKSSEGPKAGDNNLSEITRITVTYIENNEEKIKKFIVKDEGKAKSEFLTLVHGEEKEIAWYETVIRYFEDLNIIVGPKCYAIRNQWLLLEDLGASGYKTVDRIQLLDLDHSFKAVESLAKFHAVSHHLYKSNKLPDIVTKNYVFNPTDEKYRQRMIRRALYFDNIADNLEKMGETRFTDYIRSLKTTAWDTIIQCINDNTQFLCLVHGDFWTTNILFNYKNGKPQNARLIDLQLIQLCCPTYDVHYIIASSIQPTVRDCYLDEILSHYLNTLNETLASIGSSSRLSRIQFDDMMKRTSFMGVFTTLMFLPIALCESPLVFLPPDHLSQQEKLNYSPFHVVLKQKTYRNHLLSNLNYYHKTNSI